MDRMKGKYALISGGNSGIGAASARLFAREGAAGIALLDLDKGDGKFDAVAEELRAMGCQAIAIPCNVTSSAQVRAAVEQVVQAFGRIDVSVHSAGVLDYNSSVLRTSDELWDRTVAINQTGVFYCCREVLKQMEKQGEGSIVNISSVAGISGNSGAAYSSSKHAVVSLSKNIAMQYVGAGIRCNTICPGPTTTGMTELKPEEMGEDGLPNDPRFDTEFTHICSRHVDQSIGFLAAEDQAKAILFFASEDSSAVTGQWLLVDKGFY
ncbi:MAG: SDR family oxidoreductase [Oscillospiraceae bacterium]|nr:SDR family oxidoreductase [Oscillospiraceae bacterium]